MAVRLLVSDVDGTLVRSDKSLSDAVEAAVSRLRAAGVPVALISARPPSGLRWLVDRLGLDTPYAAFNGGTLLSPDHRLLAAARLPSRLAARAFAAFDRPGIIRWWFRDDQWFAERLDAVYAPLERVASAQEPVVGALPAEPDRIDKIVAVSADPALLAGVERDAGAALGSEAAVMRSQTYFLDVTAARANKGDGVAALAAAIGVSLEDVATIGDQRNDLAMFARTGLSIAMGQAPEDVRSAARLVTGTNDEDGVARAIERILLPAIGRA